jgi:hypothetical protein
VLHPRPARSVRPPVCACAIPVCARMFANARSVFSRGAGMAARRLNPTHRASGYVFNPAVQGRTSGRMFIAFRALRALIAS